MIHLVSVMISCLLMIGSSGLFPQFQLLQENQDPQAKRDDALELLAKADSIEVDFVGNRIFSDQALLAQFRLLADPDQPGKLKLPSDIAYFDALQDDLERVRFFLGTKGYILARTGKPIVSIQSGHVRITVPIEERERFRIGKISVKGVRAFSPQEIIEISGLVSGEVIDSHLLQEKVFSGVKKAYADKGCIQASVDFIPDFKFVHPLAAEGIVDVTLEVDEGRMFVIRKIDFFGKLSEEVNANKQLLFDCLLLKDGDVYSRKLLFESLKNLNRLGWFEEIRDKDVIIRTNDREQAIDINVQVREVRLPSQQ